MSKKPDLDLYVGSRDEIFLVVNGKFTERRPRQKPHFGLWSSSPQCTTPEMARPNEFYVDQSPPVQPMVNQPSFMYHQTRCVQPQANTHCSMCPQSSPEVVTPESIQSYRASSSWVCQTQQSNSFNSAKVDSWPGCDQCNSAERPYWVDDQLAEADEWGAMPCL